MIRLGLWIFDTYNYVRTYIKVKYLPPVVVLCIRIGTW